MCPPLAHFPSLTNPHQILTPYFFKSHFIIIPSTPRFFKRSLSFMFFDHKPRTFFACFHMFATCPVYLAVLGMTILIYSEGYKLWGCSHVYLHAAVTSTSLRPNILLSTLFTNTLKPCSSFTERSRSGFVQMNG